MVDRMVDAALWEIKILEEMDYDNIKISMKAFDVPTMVEAYRRLATAGAVPAAPRRHRGGHAARRLRAQRHRHRHPARGGHRRHDPRLAGGRPGRRDAGLLGHPQHAEPAPARRDARRLPHLRPHRDRADPAGEQGRGALHQARQADHGRGHGLRRQRPRRGEDGRPRHRRRQRPRRDLPQGRDHPHRRRAGVHDRADRRRRQGHRRDGVGRTCDGSSSPKSANDRPRSCKSSHESVSCRRPGGPLS